MLQQLLEHFRSGKPTTLRELATGLDVSEGLLEQMLRDLERAGYIKTIEASCDSQCAHCSQAGSCGLSAKGRIWALTAKGAQHQAS